MCQTLHSDYREGSTYTEEGHVVGMLDRDQRTAKFTKHTAEKTSPTVCHSDDRRHSESGGHEKLSQVFLRTRTKSTSANRKSNFVRKSLQKLRQLLVVGAYLLSIISIPESLAAPIDSMSSEQAKEYWMNPCNYPVEELKSRQLESDEPATSPKEDLVKICLQANIGLSHANKFRQDYVKGLQIDVDSYRKHSYPGFPNNEKLNMDVDGNIDEDHLKDLVIEDFVIQIYNYLQKFGAGLEIIIDDQEQQQDENWHGFEETKNYLRSLLCEVQEFMYNHHVTALPDITREMVLKDIAMSDTAGKTIRDWIIFRDYVTTLQYIVKVAKHLEENS